MEYIFQSYNPNYVKKNMTFKVAGTFTVDNRTNAKIQATYEQRVSTTTEASVTANIMTNAELKASFLAKLEAKVGGSLGYKRKWEKGKKYGVSVTVPAHTERVLTNYAVGVNSNGGVTYKK